MVCRINYFPPFLQSCVTEAKATGTLKSVLWGGQCWYGLYLLIPWGKSWGTASQKRPWTAQTSSLSPVKWCRHCHKMQLKVHVHAFLSTLRTSQAFQFSSGIFSTSRDNFICYQDLGKIWTHTCSNLKMFTPKYKEVIPCLYNLKAEGQTDWTLLQQLLPYPGTMYLHTDRSDLL